MHSQSQTTPLKPKARGAPCFLFDKLNGLNQHYIQEAFTVCLSLGHLDGAAAESCNPTVAVGVPGQL